MIWLKIGRGGQHGVKLKRYAAFLNQIYISIGKVNSQNTKGLVS